jgi:putative transmembrane protein PGPGW
MADPRGSNPAKRALALVGGGLLLLVGIALLVLPGPGLLLVLAGLLVLSSQFPSVDKYVDPVQDRAMKAAEDSVSSPLRITLSVLFGLGLIGVGVAWGLLGPRVPLGGWPTGSSLVLSGLILLGLLVYSYRRVARRRAESTGPGRPA